jgi:hypothetical protein
MRDPEAMRSLPKAPRARDSHCNPTPADDYRRITWREFIQLCLAMYRQVMPGVLVLSGLLVAVMLLLYWLMK